MIVAQSAAAARAFAIPHHERVDVDADILGLAAANAAAGVSGAFVVNGSPTQTAMAERAGARSQVAQVVMAGVVALVLLFATGPLQYLPRCVLAGLVFTIAVGLIDIRGLADIRRESPGEFTLAVLTAAAVALIGVEQGILLAIALSLMRHVRHSYHPHTMVLAPDATGRWVPMPVEPGMQTEPGLIVYRFGADLFYANEARFVDEVLRLVAHAPDAGRHLVVDASAITAIDYSAAQSLRDLIASAGRARSDGRVRTGEPVSALRHGSARDNGGRWSLRGSFRHCTKRSNTRARATARRKKQSRVGLWERRALIARRRRRPKSNRDCRHAFRSIGNQAAPGISRRE